VEELDGGLLLRAGDRAGFDRAKPPRRGTVDLLPKWDAYTMGHAPDGRDRLAHPDVVAHCYDHRGDGNPLVLVDGAAAGTWSLRPGKAVDFEVDLFDGTPTPKLRRALDTRLDAVRALLAA
nr:winged helix DNA-binding domain-containing protein [Actinomycetota bacterium]